MIIRDNLSRILHSPHPRFSARGPGWPARSRRAKEEGKGPVCTGSSMAGSRLSSSSTLGCDLNARLMIAAEHRWKETETRNLRLTLSGLRPDVRLESRHALFQT